MAHNNRTATPFMYFSSNDARIEGARTVNSYNTVNLMRTEEDKQTKSKIIKLLRPSNANYKMIHDEVFAARSVGTGLDFLHSKEYMAWREEEGGCRNLECVGRPGAGKTSIVSAVIEDLLKRFTSERYILYAYFRHDTPSYQTIPIVISYLLSQVVQEQGEPSQAVVDLYNEYAPEPENIVPRLDKTISVLKSEIASIKRSYIVVDALDEFSLKDRSSSFQLVGYLVELGAKLLTTSRYSIDFTAGTFSTLTVFAYDADITIFIRERLAANPRLQRLITTSPDLEKVILSGICEKCDGMFLIARLLMESLSDILTVRELRQTLRFLPKGLDAAHHLAMGRIHKQSERFRAIAHNVLEWVYFAKEPLPISTLRHAVSFKPGMCDFSEEDLVYQEDIVSSCAGLVVVVHGVIEFVHFSTRQFFERFLDEYLPNGSRHITEICLHYLILAGSLVLDETRLLSTDNKQHPVTSSEVEDLLLGVHEDEKPRHDGDLVERSYSARLPLFPYAAKFWARHARAAKEPLNPNLVAELFKSPAIHFITGPHYGGVTPLRDFFPVQNQILYCAKFGLESVIAHYLPGNNDSEVAGCHDGRETVFDLNIRSQDGKTPLLYAAENGYTSLVRMLLDNGADPNLATEKNIPRQSPSYLDGTIFKYDGHDHWTPLWYAAEIQNIEIARMLLDRGANPNIADTHGWTPLFYVVKRQRVELGKICLDARVDSNIVNKAGCQPPSYALEAQSYASEKQNMAFVQLLLDRGADPNTKDHQGRTLLLCIAKVLPSMIVPVSVYLRGKDTEYLSLLRCVMKKQDAKLVKMLLDQGADPNIADNKGRSLLSYAVENQDIPLMTTLLDVKVDVNFCNARVSYSFSFAHSSDSAELEQTPAICDSPESLSIRI